MLTRSPVEMRTGALVIDFGTALIYTWSMAANLHQLKLLVGVPVVIRVIVISFKSPRYIRTASVARLLLTR